MAKSFSHKIYEFGEFAFDEDHLMLYQNGREVQVAPKAAEILRLLLENNGQLVSKDEIMQSVWPDVVVEESNLFLYLSVLRKALGTQPDGSPWIETFRRRGYRFVGEVRVISQDPPQAVQAASNPSPGDPTKLTGRVPRGLWAALAIFLVMLTIAGFAIYRSAATAAVEDPQISTTQLTNGVDIQGAAISRDGENLLYCILEGGRQKLFLQQVGRSNAVEIPPAQNLVNSLAFSPDGRSIFYVGAADSSNSQYDIYKMPLLGGTAERLIEKVFVYSGVSFSPDGSEFTFVRYEPNPVRWAIVTASIDGKNERELVASTEEWLQYPAWSPDGRSIGFARARPNAPANEQFVSIEAVDVASGTIRPLIAERLENCFKIAWTYSGEGIVFGGTRIGELLSARRDQVWYADLHGGPLQRISRDDSRYIFEGLTRDNSALIWPVNRASQIWSVDADGNAASLKQLTRGTTDGRSGVIGLSDGRIAYMRRNGDNWEIWMMNGNGTDQRAIYDGIPMIEELRSSADGRFFVFTNTVGKGVSQLFRLNTDGSDLRSLTPKQSLHMGDSTVSPDGREVIARAEDSIDTNRSGLYRIPIEGGEVQRLDSAPASAVTPHFSSDGSAISFFFEESGAIKLGVLGLNDRSLRSFEIAEGTLTSVGAVWQPGSDTLAYIVDDGKAGNIATRTLDGLPPKQITNFTSGRIYRVNYTADGKRLLLARGYAVNDAFLVKGFAN